MNRFWKANKSTSAEIIKLLKQRQAAFRKACKMSVRVGGSSTGVYRSESMFGETKISGFVFPNKTVPDKQWVKIKGTDDGWRPRANTDLEKEVASLTSNAFELIMKLIGMKPIGSGMTIRRPGVHVVKTDVYLECPSDVKPHGCTRITDVVFERATTPKKKLSKSA